MTRALTFCLGGFFLYLFGGHLRNCTYRPTCARLIFGYTNIKTIRVSELCNTSCKSHTHTHNAFVALRSQCHTASATSSNHIYGGCVCVRHNSTYRRIPTHVIGMKMIERHLCVALEMCVSYKLRTSDVALSCI